MSYASLQVIQSRVLTTAHKQLVETALSVWDSLAYLGSQLPHPTDNGLTGSAVVQLCGGVGVPPHVFVHVFRVSVMCALEELGLRCDEQVSNTRAHTQYTLTHIRVSDLEELGLLRDEQVRAA